MPRARPFGDRFLAAITPLGLGAALCGPILLDPIPVYAQGRYQAQGAAQRHFQDGEEALAEAEEARADADEDEAQARFKDAIDAFEKAIDVDPAYVDAYARLGRVYYDLDRPAAAIPILEAGQARASDSEEIRFWLGQHLLRAGTAKGAGDEARGRVAEAVELLEAVAAGSDRFPEVHLVLGNHYYDGGRFGPASTAYRRYLEERPDAIGARARLGNAYIRQERFEEALTAFEAVREADPDNVAVLVNIGTAHLRLARYDDAAKTMSAALERDENRSSARFGLAYAHFAAERHGEAKPHFARFVKQIPDSFNGHYFGGSTLMALGEDDAALPELTRAAELRPDVAQPAYKIGIIHLRNGRSDDARAALTKAEAIKPQNPWVLSALGTADRQQGRFDAALQRHKQAVDIGSKVERGVRLARLQATLALTAEAAEQLDLARASIDRALQIGSDDPWVKQTGLAVLTRLAKRKAVDDLDGARAIWSRALELAPDDPDLRAGLAALEAAAGRPQDGLKRVNGIAQTDRASVQAAKARARFGAGQYAEAAAAYAAVDDPALAAAGAGAALLAAALDDPGRLDGAIEQLDRARALADEAGQPAPDVRRNQALAHLRKLGPRVEGGASVRLAVANDEHLPPEDVARAHYAGLIQALRRGNARDADAHLTRMTRAMREAPDGARVFDPKLGRRHVEVLTAYVNVLQKNDERARTLLDGLRESRKGRTEAGQLMRMVQHRLGRQAVVKGDLKAARKHLEAARKLGETDELRHDIAVLDWLSGRRGRQLEVWTRQAGRIRAARFNRAVALEAAGQHEEAWRAFVEAAEAGGPQAEKAAEIADAKRRVFGFGGDR